jgi:hypothetical protein
VHRGDRGAGEDLTELSQDVAEANLQGKIIDMGGASSARPAWPITRTPSCSVRGDQRQHLRRRVPDQVFASNVRPAKPRSPKSRRAVDPGRQEPEAEPLPLPDFQSATTRAPITSGDTSGGFDTWKALSRGRRTRSSVCAGVRDALEYGGAFSPAPRSTR